jgi:hypothetical protein
MFEDLCVIATLASCYLFMCALSEAIDLNEQKSNERRESMRQAAYSVKHREWIKRKNRRELWAEVSGDDYYID